jgi:predicted enzyme related to lactoylglutathione lyase
MPSVPAPGTPVGVELRTVDVAAASGFYRALLDWRVDPAGVVRLDDVPVATVRPAGAGRTRWLTAFAVDDLSAAARRVRDAGGTVAERDGAERLLATDPAGADLALVADVAAPTPPGPGRPAWFEYMTTGPAVADAFYPAVLGVSTVRPPGAADDMFVLFTAAGVPVAGRLALPPELADVLPAGWMVYVAVDDADGAAERVAALGGRVVVPPRDAPTGRVSAVADPTGAVFTLIRPAAH